MDLSELEITSEIFRLPMLFFFFPTIHLQDPSTENDVDQDTKRTLTERVVEGVDDQSTYG